MPKAFACPGCGTRIVTFLWTGESAKCSGCGKDVAVPDSAVPAEQEPRPRGPALPPVGATRRTQELVKPLERGAGARIGGIVALCVGVILLLVGIGSLGGRESGAAFGILVGPLLVLVGTLLWVAGNLTEGQSRIATALNEVAEAIRDRKPGE